MAAMIPQLSISANEKAFYNFVISNFSSPSVSSDEEQKSAKEDDVERFRLFKVKQNANLPCNFESHPAANADRLVKTAKAGNKEEMKGLATRKPSMCAKCVVCAAAVFSLIEEFEKGLPSNSTESNELEVVCHREFPLYEIWDVDGIRYLGRKTLNARLVLTHEPLTPAVEYVCEALGNSTSSSHLHRLWARNGWKQLMTDVCFDPYNPYGLSACHRMLKKTSQSLSVQRKYCGSQYLTYLLDYYFVLWRNPLSPSQIREYRLLCAWYTLADRDVEE